MAETAEQKAFVEWFKAKYPAHVKSIRVSMAGLPRHGRKGAVQWGMMKSQGVQDGESDIVILIPKGGYGALVVEHKGEGMSRTVQDNQQDYLDYHNSIGNKATSTRGLKELQLVVDEYMEM